PRVASELPWIASPPAPDAPPRLRRRRGHRPDGVRVANPGACGDRTPRPRAAPGTPAHRGLPAAGETASAATPRARPHEARPEAFAIPLSRPQGLFAEVSSPPPPPTTPRTARAAG